MRKIPCNVQSPSFKLGQVALCALAYAASACGSEADQVFIEGNTPESSIEIPVPGPSESDVVDEGQREAAPRLAEAEVGIDGDSLLVTIENRSDSAGSLTLSAMVENPTALYYTEQAASLTLAAGERRRILLSRGEVRGLDLTGSEWTD